MHAAIAQADYALPGIEDVRTLTGLTDPDAMLDFYLRLGPRVVVLKMGEAGAYLATAEQRVMIPRHVVAVVDATGAATRSAAVSWPVSSPATIRCRPRAMRMSLRR
ncbi:MAG: PfkB family carbohydrate kinase [Acetobacteraceae bacterium]